MSEVYVELKNISKRFPGVLALDNVSMSLKRGEVHGLLGENGAGKSTLIKCLTGVNIPEEGTIIVEGEVSRFTVPKMAMDRGISCIYQELNIISELSVTDNIFLGHYLKKSGVLDYTTMHKRAKEIMKRLGQDLDPRKKVGDLGVGQQQMVEIGRALSRDVQFLIMDEPTSSLSESEVNELMKAVAMLKEKGVAILFVSHKLEEVFRICDMVTILRDGELIKTAPVDTMTNASLIENMVGRSLDNLFPKEEVPIGKELMKVENLCCYGVFKDISFEVKAGEVLGFSGLVGAGRTEIFKSVFGVGPIDKGAIYLHGQQVSIKNPRESIKNKIAYVTEDRKGEGLILNESVGNNLTVVCMRKHTRFNILDKKKLKNIALKNIKSLKIKTTSSNTPVGTLSGGNQQKVVIGKWLNTEADVFILDEPTRGIDVGAKVEVYKLINELVKNGKAVIMISSELPEILGMSDRVIVMREGRITGRINRGSKSFCEKEIMKAAWGGYIDEEECEC
ncbi:sugar ABC transporter ATP-binding protein [Vallitalea okinawensis]|uniref:sugar ABC transporter ATP-binding protein n=1 Tax=Vallitalea okinawensis TaxID=2078660 RepID=UPI000CFCDD68|nr:sugar ABC transporter ATP-binding protein [Vallitalea okinawensis]